jgi:hypothetical protein
MLCAEIRLFSTAKRKLSLESAYDSIDLARRSSEDYEVNFSSYFLLHQGYLRTLLLVSPPPKEREKSGQES